MAADTIIFLKAIEAWSGGQSMSVETKCFGLCSCL